MGLDFLSRQRPVPHTARAGMPTARSTGTDYRTWSYSRSDIIHPPNISPNKSGYTTSVRGFTKGATLLSCSDSSGRESVPRQHAIPEAIPYPEATRSKLSGDLSESEIARACRVGRWPISIDLQMPCTLLRFSRGLAELCSSHQTARAGLKKKQSPNPPPLSYPTRAESQQSGRTRW